MSSEGFEVLIVDDSKIIRNILGNYLKNYKSITTAEAANGIEAMEKLRAGDFDMVLLDWSMPQKNGLEVLKEIRADENLKDIFVIMVTSEMSKENIVFAAQAGVNEYIIKPFTADILEVKLKKVLKTLLFGNYLVKKNAISTAQLYKGLDSQKAGQKTFCDLVVDLGFMTQKQVDNVNKRKGIDKFEKAAMEANMITAEDMEKIIKSQDENQPRIGEILVRQGAITNQALNERLIDFLALKAMR
ncbi:hypothetical protein MNBD_NITROSPINAE02-620 [hydrothermal vent metagenome]|uniref:Response regulatory domain-containing protein n=1 Tax=hydrothermal vent metagenome TaxID=652676 RepID=A0A3B1C271_9ZZZZ